MNPTLESIYRSHRQGLYSLAVTITGSHQLAEDSVQNAFASLFSKPPDVDDAVAYVFKSVRNSAIDVCRSSNRQSQLKESLFNGFHPPSASTKTPSEVLLTKESHEQLRVAIQWLPPNEQEAIVLKAFADLTFEQAGKVASVPAKTIATRYRRALMKLENRLRDQI